MKKRVQSNFLTKNSVPLEKVNEFVADNYSENPDFRLRPFYKRARFSDEGDGFSVSIYFKVQSFSIHYLLLKDTI